MNTFVLAKFAEVSVQLSPESISKRDGILKDAKSVCVVDCPLTLEDAVICLKTLQVLQKSAEKSRTDVKSPVLDLGRAIDAKAKEFCGPLDIEIARINKLVTNYQAEQRRIAEEAERRRQSELQRIAKEQREAEGREAKARRDAEAAEEERLKASTEASATIDTDVEKSSLEDARIAEAKRQESERSAQLEAQRLSSLAAEKAKMQTQVAVAPANVSGLVTKVVWKFEVVDVHKLYAFRANLCRLEASASAINSELDAGLRECPGLRIWSEIKTEVRS